MAFDHDFIIIGSGFGGSVSALRLVEKGYDVLMLEQGKRFRAEDFPESNWEIKRWLWEPALGCEGFFQLRWFRHVTVLAGAGVGGGSLTYANTLPIPKTSFFQSSGWGSLADWERELAPHYQTALRMLGATPTPFTTQPDKLLKQLAESRGQGDRFEPTHVSVYFGQPGVKVSDPYFNGEGPDRTGCIRCGACMTGCRHDAKNSLDKNYLYFAEKRGLRLLSETEATRIVPLPGGGYRVEMQRKLGGKKAREQLSFTATRVIVSAGALGTNELLLRQRQDEGALPKLSARLGTQVRTNSESLLFVTVPDRSRDLSKGIAIGSIFQISDSAHLEVVRYGEGSGFFRLLQTPHISGGGSAPARLARTLGLFLKHPRQVLRALTVGDWAKHTIILLYMKTTEGTLRFSLGRSALTGMKLGLVTELEDGEAPTATIPEATELAHALAKLVGGVPFAGLPDTVFDIPTTAHILGGCPMGEDASLGVIDAQHQVFGYPGLYVIDGSAISANPGVNPSLTICALAERAISAIPAKGT